MATIKLFSEGTRTAVLNGTVTGSQFAVSSLQFDDPTHTFVFGLGQDDVIVDIKWLGVPSGTEYRFTAPTTPDFGFEKQFVFVWNDEGRYLFGGRHLDMSAGVTTTLAVRIAATGQQLQDAAIELTFDGHFELATAGLFANASCVVSLSLMDLAQLAPRPGLALPDIGWSLPSFPVNWSWFSLLDLSRISLPAVSFDVPALQGRVSYQTLTMTVTNTEVTFDFRGVVLAIGGQSIEGNISFKYKDGDVTIVSVALTKPAITFGTVPEYYFDGDCVILHGTGNQLQTLVQRLAPELDALVPTTITDWTVRALRTDGRVEEVRIDLILGTETLALPGFTVKTPASTTLHLVFHAPLGEKPSISVAMTIIAGVEIALAFNLDRAGTRELMPDQSVQPKLLKFQLAPTPPPLTVLIAKFPAGGTPEFIQKPITPFPALPIANPHIACQPTTDQYTSLIEGDVSFTYEGFNLSQVLPFLQNRLAPISQVVRIVSVSNQPAEFTHHVIPLTVTLEVQIGTLTIRGNVNMELNWHTMAFKAGTGDSLKLRLESRSSLKPPPKQDLFGLKWAFIPGTGDSDFELITKDSDYRLMQSPGCKILLEFDRATSPKSPIQFEVKNFVLAAGGVSLDAAILPTPAKLAALEQEFMFTEGLLQIRDNRIAGFAIGGSGNLPPALVGPAKADIHLRFEQHPDDGSVHLIEADARIQGDSLLKCDSTRFQFALTALGLKFVEEDARYHLYFTLSGMARFVLADGDGADGPLGWLPSIEMQMVDCPLTTDIRVLSRHVTFLIPLPKPQTFPFLGCFEFELRAIGFAPMDPVFRDPKPAMIISGQIMFSGGADTVDVKVDFHNLHIGLPAAGKRVPQLYLKGLGIKVSVGSAFELGGSLDFLDEGTNLGGGITGEGFSGTGELMVHGLPRITAGFAFLRIRRNPQDPPVKAWFIYLEANRFSLEMPVIRVFLREIGIGFGYRFTLAMIKSVDEVEDPKQLLKVLKDQAKRQGELARFETWRADLEEPGEDPRWTIALRAMISQNSAAATPTDWNPKKEKTLPNLFLLDAMAAVRSDLTILMTVRAWLLTSYHDFTLEQPSTLRERPLFAGFVMLSPRKKRLLANLSSNPDAVFGTNSPMPEILAKAIRGAKFSATLLVEPGLVHYELGWPNQLRWEADFDVLKLQFCGGLIYRVSTSEFVIGQSFLARGSLEFTAGVDFGWVGAKLSATASVAYGARYIGVLGFDSSTPSAFYGGAGIEINVEVDVAFWVEVDLLVGSITKHFGFHFGVNFTASVEVGILLDPNFGVRGSATLGLNVMGHDFQFAIRVAVNEGAVQTAFDRTNRFLNIGLEAGDVEPIPGVEAAARSVKALLAAPQEAFDPQADQYAALACSLRTYAGDRRLLGHSWDDGVKFETPSYRVLIARVGMQAFFVLVPSAEPLDSARADRIGGRERGFLPVPPESATTAINYDFKLELTIPSGVAIHQVDSAGSFSKVVTPTYSRWKADWTAPITFNKLEKTGVYAQGSTPVGQQQIVTLRNWLSLAFQFDVSVKVNSWEDIVPIGDPILPFTGEQSVQDHRVRNPAEDSFEAAVRGATEQFTASPYLKYSDGEYDVTLRDAFHPGSTIYGNGGTAELLDADRDITRLDLKTQQVFQTRSVMLSTIIRDFQEHVEEVRGNTAGSFDPSSLACTMGLVFRVDLNVSGNPDDNYNELINKLNEAKISQRDAPSATDPSAPPSQPNVRVFNPPRSTFAVKPPKLDGLEHYSHEGTIAFDWSLLWPNSARAATATATVSSGQVTAINLLRGSRGYSSYRPPSVVIDGPGATAWVKLTTLDSSGALTAESLVLGLPGSGYDRLHPPTITIDPPPAGGTQATAQIDPRFIDAKGALLKGALKLDNFGSGYTALKRPGVSIALPPGAVQATAKVTTSDIDLVTGEIFKVTIVNPGAGYPLAPAVTIEPVRLVADTDPQHHLDYYRIRRRSRDGTTGEREFRVKAGEILHRDAGNVLRRLRPRFQFVDHFEDEPAGALVDLPSEGRAYSYTIVPVDLAGNPSSRPQTVIVRRRPATAPAPITDSEFIVDYEIDNIPEPVSGVPQLRPLDRIAFAWVAPVDPQVGPKVVIESLRLVFRRDDVLAIGQYAQDSDFGGPRSRGLATSNARPLRTDLRTEDIPLLLGTELANPDSGQRRFSVELHTHFFSGRSVDSANEKRLTLPDLAGPPITSEGPHLVTWTPVSWRVFVQTKSASGVYSALVPVQLRMRFVKETIPLDVTAKEERRPAALEWIPNPVPVELLPPRDLTGQPGFALVPMPPVTPADGALGGEFLLHPNRRRVANLAWNQAGSPNPPLPPEPQPIPREFFAGHELFEFDVDSHLADTLNASLFTISEETLIKLQAKDVNVPQGVITKLRDRLLDRGFEQQADFQTALNAVLTAGEFKDYSPKIISAARLPSTTFPRWAEDAKLSSVQRFEMLPADLLLVTPPDTSDAQKWEAWYPSQRKRRELQLAAGRPRGSEAIHSAWYSWRESVLDWPNSVTGDRIESQFVPAGSSQKRFVVKQRLHRFLRWLIDTAAAGNPGSTVVYGPTPRAPESLSALMTATSPATDPYGWTILNHLGLSASFHLRDRLGEPIAADEIISKLLKPEINATAKVTAITNGGIDSSGILITNPGYYDSLPTVTIDPPPLTPGGTAATATIDASGLDPVTGKLGPHAIRVTSRGSGYDLHSPPSIHIIRSDSSPLKFLFVECLFQPAKGIQSATDESNPVGISVKPGDLLGVVQVSLRPIVKQTLFYKRFVFEPLTTDTITISVKPAIMSAVDVTPPVLAPTQILIRGTNADLPIEITANTLLSVPRPAGPKLIVLARAPQNQAPTVTIGTPAQEPVKNDDYFGPDDPDSRPFVLDVTQVAKSLVPPRDANPERWTYLKDAIEALNPREASRDSDQFKLKVPDLAVFQSDKSGPTDQIDLQTILDWLARFFDHGGNTKEHADEGPWLAMAVPRSLAVTAIAPAPKTGLLEYCHPVTDLYERVRRYLMKPTSRYDALWASLSQSHRLFRTPQNIGNTDAIRGNLDRLRRFQPPTPGGLDLVMPRLRAVAPPSVIFSGRLDAPAADSLVPQPPGRTWQVVIAKHPEQAMSEKNRTLARRLAWRQVSVALLRRFQGDDFSGPLPFTYTSTKAFASSGPILSSGDTLTLTVDGKTTVFKPNNLADLKSGLEKADPAGTVEIWNQTSTLSLLILRSKPPVTLVRNIAGGGTTEDWLKLQASQRFDQYATVEFPVAGPLLSKGQTFVLRLLTEDRTLTLAGNTLPDLQTSLRNALDGSTVQIVAGSTASQGRLLIRTFLSTKLLRRESGRTDVVLSVSRRPVPPSPNAVTLPGPIASLVRRDVLTDYVIADYVIADPVKHDEVAEKDRLRQLDLPRRLGQFGRGAVIYQWQNHPYYYQQLLLAVAQSTDVVSEITTVLQRDFEYIAPPPRAVMEGGQDVGGRYRRVVMRLENYFNSLPPASQMQWPAEKPDTSDPAVSRPYSATVDPLVVYQLILKRPGGVMQVVAQIFADPQQPTGFNIRNFPVTVAGTSCDAEVISRIPWGFDKSKAFEEYLELFLRPPSAADVVRPVTSRHAFDATKLTAALTGTAALITPADTVLFPRTATLVLTQRLLPGEIAALETLLTGGPPRDAAFRHAAGAFLNQIRDFNRDTDSSAVPDIRETISCGLDQLAELNDDPQNVIINGRRLTWIANSTTSLFTTNQKLILTGDAAHAAWLDSPTCGRTLKTLVDADATTFITLLFNATEAVPVISAALSARLIFPAAAPGTLNWTFGPIAAVIMAELTTLSTTVGPTLQAAISKIITIRDRRAFEVDIVESDFAARPGVADFRAAGLAGVAGICRGTMKFTGLMLNEERIALEAARKPDASGLMAEIDAPMISLLRRDTLQAGFDGATLQIQSIRGSANAVIAAVDVRP